MQFDMHETFSVPVRICKCLMLVTLIYLWSSECNWALNALWSLYAPAAVTLQNLTLYPQSVCVHFMWLPKILSFFWTANTGCVICEFGTKFLILQKIKRIMQVSRALTVHHVTRYLISILVTMLDFTSCFWNTQEHIMWYRYLNWHWYFV